MIILQGKQRHPWFQERNIQNEDFGSDICEPFCFRLCIVMIMISVNVDSLVSFSMTLTFIKGNSGMKWSKCAMWMI